MKKGRDQMKEADWAVIFDVDGTMVDNAKYHSQAWIDYGRNCGLGIDIDAQYYLEHLHARSNDNIVRHLYGEDVSDEQIEEVSREKEEMYRESFRPVIKENAGLINLLKALRDGGVKCAVASNSVKGNVEFVLDELDIWQYFEVVLDNCQVTHGKPHPEVLLSASEKLGIAVDKCVLIEDSSSGFKAAENANMAYIVITNGEETEDLKHATGAKGMHVDFTGITPEYLKGLIDGQPC